MFDPALHGEGRELLLPESEQRHRFTGDIVERNQAKYAAIVQAIAEGLGVRQIAQAFGVSYHTVTAVREREPHLVATVKERFGKPVNQLRELAAERFEEALTDGKIAAGQLPVAFGILVDKSLALAGEPTVRVAVKRELSFDELRRAFEALAPPPIVVEVPSPDSLSGEMGLDSEGIRSIPRACGMDAGTSEPPIVAGTELLVEELRRDFEGVTDAVTSPSPTTAMATHGADEPAPKKGGEGVAFPAGAHRGRWVALQKF